MSVTDDRVRELHGSFLEFMSKPENVEAATKEIYEDLLDEVLMGFVFDVHRVVKTGSSDVEEGIPDDESYAIVDSPGLDVFGQHPIKKSQECNCPNCERGVAASRFATHLEKCMGMGRNSSRIASRRIANNSKDLTTFSGVISDDDDDVDWSANNDKRKRRKERNGLRKLKQPRQAGLLSGALLAGPAAAGNNSSGSSSSSSLGANPKNGSDGGELVYTSNENSPSNFEAMSLEEKRALLQQVCGVLSEHTKKICTRSTRCPQHSDEQRREVRQGLEEAQPLPGLDLEPAAYEEAAAGEGGPAAEVSVVDVYDIASEIGKECEKLIDAHGAESISSLMPKVIGALELLESLATRNERENTAVQELSAKVAQLESDKIGKAEDRLRFEKELEQIEDHWKQESRDLLEMVNRLQEENRRLATAVHENKSDSDDSGFTSGQEVDVAVLQRLRTMIDKQREQIRSRDRELEQKGAQIENLNNQVDKLTVVGRELKRKQRQAQMQARGLVEERADFLAQLQDQNRELINLRARLGLARKENEDLFKSQAYPDLANKVVYDVDDPDRPRFTTAELKEILHERNELKTRVAELEEELELYRPKAEPVDADKDAPVQGPLPYEPDDAPWKKSESGIRKFFRKIFSETSGSGFLGGSSPRRSLSSLSKMALSGSSAGETCG